MRIRRGVRCLIQLGVFIVVIYNILKLSATWFVEHPCISKPLFGPWKHLDNILRKGVNFSNSAVTFDRVVLELVDAYYRGDYINIAERADVHSKVYLHQPFSLLKRATNNTLLIFVQSYPDHFQQRTLIRRTWGKPSNYRNSDIIVLFAMGLTSTGGTTLNDAMEMERRYHDDILLLNMHDTYDNLTYKGLLTMTWIANQFPRFKHILKTDDDILLNTYSWLQVIGQLRAFQISCCIVGCVWPTPEVIRYDKYIVTRSEYEYNRYPSFCSGSAYLMTRDAMINIIGAAFHLPFLRRDDPYFTGIVREQVGVPLIRLPLHTYLLTQHDKTNRDKLEANDIMVVHHISQRKWNSTWARLRRVYLTNDYTKTTRLRVQRPFRINVPPDWELPSNYSCPVAKCEYPLDAGFRIRIKS